MSASGRVAQEARDLRGKRLVLIGGVALAVFGAAVWVAAGLLQSERGTLLDPAAPALGSRATLDGLEQGQIEARARGLRQERRARQRLESYGWADESRGIAHVPIDLAIDRLVEQARDGGARSSGFTGTRLDERQDAGPRGGAAGRGR